MFRSWYGVFLFWHLSWFDQCVIFLYFPSGCVFFLFFPFFSVFIPCCPCSQAVYSKGILGFRRNASGGVFESSRYILFSVAPYSCYSRDLCIRGFSSVFPIVAFVRYHSVGVGFFIPPSFVLDWPYSRGGLGFVVLFSPFCFAGSLVWLGMFWVFISGRLVLE